MNLSNVRSSKDGASPISRSGAKRGLLPTVLDLRPGILPL